MNGEARFPRSVGRWLSLLLGHAASVENAFRAAYDYHRVVVFSASAWERRSRLLLEGSF